MNARYKSGEDYPTHSDITTAGLTAFIEDKGFWATGLDGILISLTIPYGTSYAAVLYSSSNASGTWFKW